MTTLETTRQRMVYSHTIGLSTMEGRGFYYPVDTVCASDGKLYTISRSLEGDVRGVRVTIYDIDSEYYGTFSEFGEGAGQFIWPVAITQNGQGHIYISDEDKNVVTGFDTSGAVVNHWGETGSAPGQLDGPAGLAFDVGRPPVRRRPAQQPRSGVHPGGRADKRLRLAGIGRRAVQPPLGNHGRPRRLPLRRRLAERPRSEAHARRRVHKRRSEDRVAATASFTGRQA